MYVAGQNTATDGYFCEERKPIFQTIWLSNFQNLELSPVKCKSCSDYPWLLLLIQAGTPLLCCHLNQMHVDNFCYNPGVVQELKSMKTECTRTLHSNRNGIPKTVRQETEER